MFDMDPAQFKRWVRVETIILFIVLITSIPSIGWAAFEHSHGYKNISKLISKVGAAFSILSLLALSGYRAYVYVVHGL